MRALLFCSSAMIGLAGLSGCGSGVDVGHEAEGGGGAGAAGAGADTAEICTCMDGCGSCPDVDVVTVELYDFAIDSTEVTNSQYASFLAANVPPQSQWSAPGLCEWNTSYTPSNAWPAYGKDDHPVVWVDRCDAIGFCAWAGKHLCGKIGAASDVAVDSWISATESKWFNACGRATADGNVYPYGKVYQGDACNGEDYGVGETIVVGHATGCTGVGEHPYDGIFDLSGNVAEWADRTSATQVMVRGGSFDSDKSYLSCGVVELFTDVSEADARGDIGFRCCG